MDRNQVKQLFRSFIRYTSLNSIAMLGVSFYILVDTYFIALYVGSNGLAALTLMLPIYFFLMSGPGVMLAVGGSANFSISIGRREYKNALSYAHTAILIGVIYSLVFTVLFWLFRDQFCYILGVNEDTYLDVKNYLSYLVSFTIFYVLNHIYLGLIKNDGYPQLVMIAMVVSNFANAFFDWLFMGPFNMGMSGAALATGASPTISMLILAIYFLKEDRKLYFFPFQPKLDYIKSVLCIGFPAYITEASSGFATFTFNRIILLIAGTIGVSAYGVIANTALVVIFLLTGIAQGVQPLVSFAYGSGNKYAQKRLWRWGCIAMFATTMVISCLAIVFAPYVVQIFNDGNQLDFANLATNGLRIYYLAFPFMGIGILASNYFAAVANAKISTTISLSRAVLLPIPILLLFSWLFGMNGVWLTIPVAELLTFMLVIYLRKKVSY